MINAPKGVEDILPPKSEAYSLIEKEAAFFFSLYGYRQIRIPTFEKTELFLRSVGEETDVGKQMYTFKDKRGRSISLRPEGTAGVVRAYIEHKIFRKEKLWKVCYQGPMFRYERPQAGRLREFYQIGVECFGEENPWIDVEILEMAFFFLKRLGLNAPQINLNSIGCKDCRKDYIIKLKSYLEKNINFLCDTCKRRFYFNPLRILDCKNEKCNVILKKAPTIENFLCSSCKEHFEAVKEKLSSLDIPFVVDPYLVRGLDYYTRTIFEIKSSYLGSQDTICAGGRYDNLIEELGGPSIPAMGFAIGVERLFLVLQRVNAKIFPPAPPCILVIPFGKGCTEKGILIARSLRSQGIQVRMDFDEKRSLSSRLRRASKKNFPWVLIIGEEELKQKRYILKNMRSGDQEYLQEEQLENIKSYLKGESKV